MSNPREHWPVRRFALGEEPGDDLSDSTTPAERLAMMWRATPGIVYQIGLPPSRIDALTQITGVTFDDAWSRRESVDLEGSMVHFLGRDALVRNKEATGRAKDLADVARLRRR